MTENHILYIAVKGWCLNVDVRPKDILVMKKKHPCGSFEMYVIRSGMDFKLRCLGCSREFMIPRNKIEKNIKKIIRNEEK